MEHSFSYKIQLEASAKTAVGRKSHFLIEKTFNNILHEMNISKETAKTLNIDADGDLYLDTIEDMMRENINEYCKRYGLIKSTVEVSSYTVHTDDVDVVLYFNDGAETQRTENKDAFLMGYRIEDSESISVVDLTGAYVDDSVVLKWSADSHYHGSFIYDENKTLITKLKIGVLSWKRKTNINKNSTYYVSVFNSLKESALKKVDIIAEPTFVEITSEYQKEIPHLEREKGDIDLFQSGIGDLDDLKVSIKEDEAKESFRYSVRLTGIETVDGKATPYIGEVVNKAFEYTCLGQEELFIKDTFANPFFNESLNNKNLKDMRLIVRTDNPNIKLDVLEQPNFNDDEYQFITFKSVAKIKDINQTSWNPSSDSGFYYLNQKEHYLFGESNVENDRISGESFDTFDIHIDITVVFAYQSSSSSVTKKLITKGKADGKLLKLEDDSIKEMMDAAIIDAGFPLEEIIIGSYSYTYESEAPVELSVRGKHNPSIELDDSASIEEGCFYAQSHSNAMKALYENRYVELEGGRASLYPTPVAGSPIVIYDGDTSLTQTFFYDTLGNPTHKFTEEITFDEYGHARLSYIDVSVKELSVNDSVIPTIKISAKDGYLACIDCKNKSGLVTYTVENSFYVDYNYGIDSGKVEISVASQPDKVKVYYETSNEASRLSREIELNPLKSSFHTGFIYLSDSDQEVDQVQLVLPKENIYAGSKEQLTARVFVTDKNGNPCSNVDVQFISGQELLTSDTCTTNLDGMAYIDFVSPASSGEIEIVAVAEGKKAYGYLNVKEYTRKGRIFLTVNNPVTFPDGRVVEVTAHLYGKDQEVLKGAEVTFIATSGDLSSKTATTDNQGKAKVTLMPLEIPKTGMIDIEASYQDLSSHTLVRIEGYAYYHPDFLIRGNNLIDLYDGAEARRNLGIDISKEAPENPGKNDFWVDTKDMYYFAQRYQLRDILSREDGRTNLGIKTGKGDPLEPWANDLWVEEDEVKEEDVQGDGSI